MGDAGYNSSPHFDEIGRLSTVTDNLGDIDFTGAPRDSVVSTTYVGSTTVTTRRWDGHDLQQSRTETKNVLGKLAVVTDAKGVKTTYWYDSEGNLTDAGDPETHQKPTVHIDYDPQRSWKTQTIDPDLGTWTYEYNGFGDLIAQTDAAHNRVTMTYDALGRMTSKDKGTVPPFGSTTSPTMVRASWRAW